MSVPLSEAELAALYRQARIFAIVDSGSVCRLIADLWAARSALAEYADEHNWWQANHLEPEGWVRPVWSWNDHRLPWRIAAAALSVAAGEKGVTGG